VEVTKRLIEIDDELLANAQRILGAPTMKAAVTEALEEVVKHELRMQHLQRLATMDGLDLDKPEVMKGAWPEPYTSQTNP
jgi:Arc/MetJ family transcription regulator